MESSCCLDAKKTRELALLQHAAFDNALTSKPAHEKQHDDDDQQDTDDTDAAMTEAVAVAAEPATEAAKQEDDEDDDEDESDRHVLPRITESSQRSRHFTLPPLSS
jgi:hypothetical protein